MDNIEFIFSGKTYTKDTFIAEMNISEEDFDQIYPNFVEKGKFKPKNLTNENESRKKAFEKLIDEYNEDIEANTIRETESDDIFVARERATADIPKHERITYKFKNKYDAQGFAKAVFEMGIASVDNITDPYKVIIRNVTQIEATKLSTLYHARNLGAGTSRFIDKTARGAMNVAGYAMSDIVSPVAKTAINSGKSVAKSLLGFVKETGAAAISATADAIREVKAEDSQNESILKAKSDLRAAKTCVTNKLKEIGGLNSGISYD